MYIKFAYSDNLKNNYSNSSFLCANTWHYYISGKKVQFSVDAPWCGHCKRLAPAYSEAARLLQSENSPVKLAKIDGSEYKTIMDKYKAKGFPNTNFSQLVYTYPFPVRVSLQLTTQIATKQHDNNRLPSILPFPLRLLLYSHSNFHSPVTYSISNTTTVTICIPCFPTLKLFTNGGKTSTDYPDTLDRSTSSIVRCQCQ